MGSDDAGQPAFGQYLRQLRLEQGLSQQALAKLVYSSKSHVQEFEAGKCLPRPETVLRLDSALEAGGRLVALAQATRARLVASRSTLILQNPRSGDVVQLGQEGHDVRRRRLISTLSRLAAASPTLVRLEALRQGLEHAIGATRNWDAIVGDYANCFYTTPADVLYDRLSVDVGILLELLADNDEDRELQRATANVSMILAVTLTSYGQIWMARRWWATARDAADKSADVGVRVMTRSQEAIKGLYDGRPLGDVLDLTEEALALAGGRVDPGVAGALATRAQVLATIGRTREAVDAVHGVEEVTSRMPAAALADESMFGWPVHRLRHTESFVYTEVGDTGRAAVAQEAAIKLYPEKHAINRAMVLLHQAACLIRQRHARDGLRHAAYVLDALPTEQHTQLVYDVARRTVALVPAKERGRAEFDGLHERLAALRGQ